jgi:hypothetical protein
MILQLAKQAGMVKDEDFVLKMESIGGRGITCNLDELSEFARIVGRIAREDERRKQKRNSQSMG